MKEIRINEDVRDVLKAGTYGVIYGWQFATVTVGSTLLALSVLKPKTTVGAMIDGAISAIPGSVAISTEENLEMVGKLSEKLVDGTCDFIEGVGNYIVIKRNLKTE